MVSPKTSVTMFLLVTCVAAALAADKLVIPVAATSDIHGKYFCRDIFTKSLRRYFNNKLSYENNKNRVFAVQGYIIIRVDIF